MYGFVAMLLFFVTGANSRLRITIFGDTINLGLDQDNNGTSDTFIDTTWQELLGLQGTLSGGALPVFGSVFYRSNPVLPPGSIVPVGP